MRWLLLCLVACQAEPKPSDEPTQSSTTDTTTTYGERTLTVPAAAHWVNTGLYVEEGAELEFSVSGTWSLDDVEVGVEGDESLGERTRGCNPGSFVIRTGLAYEGEISCAGSGGTYTAPRDGIVFLGMAISTDLGDSYGQRLRADGSLSVTIESDGLVVPTVPMAELEDYAFKQVASGWVELQSEHHLVVIEESEVRADRATAVAALELLDEMYEIQTDLRGAVPFEGERIRWFPDEAIEPLGYMLAGNPIRTNPLLMNGSPEQRILRANEPTTDIWGFAHELGHTFTTVGGTWVYMIVNIESWPNLFTLRTLETVERTEFQPNYDTYCDGRDAYLADGDYETLATDPFLQLCFLTEFQTAYGDDFYDAFFRVLNDQTNDDVGYDGTDASAWSYMNTLADDVAGEPTAPTFERWRVPLP